MHNKFCLIDEKVVITGSYNWSRRARKNRENIMIIKDSPRLIGQFLGEFNQIKLFFNTSNENDIKELNKINYEKVFDRLKTILQLIERTVFEEIEGQLIEIERLLSDDRYDTITQEVNDVLTTTRSRDYDAAEKIIKTLIAKHQQMVVFGDLDIPQLEFDKEILSIQLSALEEERSEVLRLIRRFEARYNIELGALILEILQLKKDFSKQKNEGEAFEEANSQYEKFKETYCQLSGNNIDVLSEEEEHDIKKLFKKASKMCHPDLVQEEFKALANQTFIELRDAFESGNLKKVKEILRELEANNWIKSSSAIINTKYTQLMHQVSVLRRRVTELMEELLSLRSSESYQIISSIQNWDSFFKDSKIRLKEELETLRTHEPINQNR
jgi:hypothetical protein